jgi:hypothetical protein
MGQWCIRSGRPYDELVCSYFGCDYPFSSVLFMISYQLPKMEKACTRVELIIAAECRLFSVLSIILGSQTISLFSSTS